MSTRGQRGLRTFVEEMSTPAPPRHNPPAAWFHHELRHQRVMRKAERLWTTQLEPALVYGAALITTSWALVRVFVG
jgi:hypothetical protein